MTEKYESRLQLLAMPRAVVVNIFWSGALKKYFSGFENCCSNICIAGILVEAHWLKSNTGGQLKWEVKFQHICIQKQLAITLQCSAFMCSIVPKQVSGTKCGWILNVLPTHTFLPPTFHRFISYPFLFLMLWVFLE